MSYLVNASDFAPPVEEKPQPAKQVAQQFHFDAEASQSPQQNEIDLRNNPILQELGVDFSLIGKKLLGILPFFKLTQDVASAPEMILALPVLMILFCFSKAVPQFFGSLFYGSVIFRIFILFLTQGQKSVEFYGVFSVLVYGSVPIAISWIFTRFLGGHIYSLVGGFLGCFSISKQFMYGWDLDRVLIGLYAVVISWFWVLFAFV
ncbi:Transmembrane domain-containing protein [Spironucleus salmonicida]|uniref:Transmembrane domain-containing protein n=1 Tax=Spironucleus salmonicida TaxID=348837 RepID=V6LM34_9EUKA|nr:Transmembrane domain-containing protein [Spironucleus salmonicida]|eukprot:EST41769.1 Transmembrane domain-containing protein [Spironucleus salmonicida]